MSQSYAALNEAPSREASIQHEKPLEVADTLATGLDEESSIAQGVGATLELLRQRNLMKDQHGEELNDSLRTHQRFLAEKQARETEADRSAKAKREADRATGKLDRMSAREREDYARSANARREQMESRAVADLFNKEYKPNIDIKYVDEYGRRMNEKEAFKHLSHQFHGKGSGKQKHEKRLKKIEEERRREAQSALDGSQIAGGSSGAGAKMKSQKTAGVRLQ